jgi:hypothetical protein
MTRSFNPDEVIEHLDIRIVLETDSTQISRPTLEQPGESTHYCRVKEIEVDEYGDDCPDELAKKIEDVIKEHFTGMEITETDIDR